MSILSTSKKLLAVSKNKTQNTKPPELRRIPHTEYTECHVYCMTRRSAHHTAGHARCTWDAFVNMVLRIRMTEI